MNGGSGTTRIDCTTVAPLLGHYLAEKVDEANRLAIRNHLLSCGSCSTEAQRLDPGVLFMRLGQERPAAESWVRFDAQLRARLEAEAGKSRGVFAGWDFSRLQTAVRVPRLAYAAPLAMLAVLAGLVFVTQPGLIRGPRPRVEAIRPPHEIVGTVRPLDPHGPAGRIDPARRASLRLAGPEAALLPTLEQVTSPAARVYRLDVGAPSAAANAAAAGDSGAVYFVVDETINF